MTEGEGTPTGASRLPRRVSLGVSKTDLTGSVIAKLQSLAETHGEDECWPWRWGKTSSGYGNVRLNLLRRNIGAHVAAYALAYGSRPDGAVIIHTCDNPPCCNPRHLLAVTQARRQAHPPRPLTADMVPDSFLRILAELAEHLSPRECWPWPGCLEQNGYGVFRPTHGIQWWRAHRLSAALVYGEIPQDLIVLHECDNRRCCNPAHLRVGSVLENNQDMVSKERMSQAMPVLGPDGRRYPSISEAARSEGIFLSSMRKRLRSKRRQWRFSET